MGRTEDTTATQVAAAYEAIVGLGARVSLSGEGPGIAAETPRMRAAYEGRTGAFGPEDPWFEVRSRAFWDDALTTQGFAKVADAHLPASSRSLVPRLARAHRGFFVVHDDRIVDLWSGVELAVGRLDESQAISLAHAEGAFDGRVIAAADTGPLYVLPGAYHHHPDALAPALKILAVARERNLATQVALDALMRMDLVLRKSSRVKAAFAYRVESLPLA